MPRQYFPSKFHLDNRVRYFLWSSEVESKDNVDRDEVWTRSGIAPTFATLAQVEAFARDEVGVALVDEGEPLLHDLSYVTQWLRLKKSRRARQVYAGHCLSAWNIFSDLARGLCMPFSGDEHWHDSTYSKLLFGEFPWSGAEIEELHFVLSEGLNLWRAHVR